MAIKARGPKPRFNYGHISILDELWKEQHGCCAICCEPAETHHDLHLDHDHRTMKIRGLLCNRCNTGIGWFMDNPAWLREAAAYLDKWKK